MMFVFLVFLEKKLKKNWIYLHSYRGNVHAGKSPKHATNISNCPIEMRIDYVQYFDISLFVYHCSRRHWFEAWH